MFLDSKKIPEHVIKFDALNTIGIASAKWDKNPVNYKIKDIPLYCGWLVCIVSLVWLIFIGFSMTAVWLLVGFAVIVFVAANYFERRLTRKHRENQLRYRQEYVPKLAALLKEHGLTLPAEEQRALTTTMKSKLRVLNEDGVEYRSAGLWAHEDDNVTATFFLHDETYRKLRVRAEFEERVLNFLHSYEKEHGEFETLGERDAFLAGVRKALR